jgi:hypothetical protein
MAVREIFMYKTYAKETRPREIRHGLLSTIAFCSLLGMIFPLDAPAQNRNDRDDRNRNDAVTTIERGTVVPVRTNEAIDVERRDNRVYSGVVDQDVRGGDGRIAIPRGSTVELMVRTTPDSDLLVDLESVVANGQRFGIKTDPARVESQKDNSIVGAITGAVTGVRGRAVRVPRDTVLTFRLERPLNVGVTDRGVDREGHHYHDFYGDK